MLLVSATKGLENDSLLRMTEVISDVLSHGDGSFQPRLCALSGPSFAREVAQGYPTAVSVASADPQLSARVQELFSDANFRLYRNEDVIGVELGGAVKNVIAIAAGVVNGIGYGYNTVAGLITRGLAEMTRLTVACGGRADTMSGLSGLGDLVLTCTGGLSRNRSVGVELGRGRKLDEIIADMHGMVAEGVLTTSAAVGLAHSVGVELPIIEQMHLILQRGKAPGEAIRDLMQRPLAQESALYRN
jgi:glycerol-3-phosphate dehydrogenase (NAD(P)+)